MHAGRRRAPAWLALAAIVIYGFAPVFAALRPAGAAPPTCVTEAAHACSCRAEPHAERDCCCGAAARETRCGVRKLPCDAEAGAEVVLTFGRHFVVLPRRALELRPALAKPAPFPPDAALPPALAADITPPPPRPANAP